MMGIFGQKKTMKGKICCGSLIAKFKLCLEIVREQKRMIDKSIRELERERRGLEQSEKKLQVDIKKAAKESTKNMVCIL
jgi:charged multivesicular body protein 2A